MVAQILSDGRFRRAREEHLESDLDDRALGETFLEGDLS